MTVPFLPSAFCPRGQIGASAATFRHPRAHARLIRIRIPVRTTSWIDRLCDLWLVRGLFETIRAAAVSFF